MTDGPIELRAVLHPESGNKAIALVGIVWQKYFDLRKEFKRCFQDVQEKLGDIQMTMQHMLQCMHFMK